MNAPTSNPTPDALPIAVAELSARCMGNTAIALLVLSKFELQLRKDLLDIEQRWAAGDSDAVGRISHSLKGAAGATAATFLHDLAATIEQHARQNRLTLVQQLLPLFKAEADRCLAFIPVARGALKRPMESAA